MSVKFLVHFTASNKQFRSVNNHTNVAQIGLGLVISWLVFSSHISRAKFCHSTKWNSCCIK